MPVAVAPAIGNLDAMNQQRTVLITGASDGIGKSAATLLSESRPDTRLLLVGRNPEKTREIAQRLGTEYFTADFADLEQVRTLAADILATTDRIDVLANNAGGIFSGPEITGDDFEKTWQVNVVAPWLLTNLLRGPLRESRANVVATSSIAAFLFARFTTDDPGTRENFTDSRAYGNAKLGDAMMTAELAKRFPELGPVAFHPGVIATNFAQETSSSMKNFYRLLGRSSLAGPEGGGRRLAHFIEGTPGVHFERGRFYLRPGLPVPLATQQATAVFRDLDEQLGLHWD